MLLMIDNYDSFTYNLVQYFAELGEEVKVFRNDEIAVEEIAKINPARICISPGPCSPREAGISVETIKRYAGQIPILGVCLGHQAIGVAFGATVSRAPELLHGKTSLVTHNNGGILHDIKSPLTVTRYHSLAIEPQTVPAGFEVICATDGGVVMGIQHSTLPISGVQFHPESVLTEHGHQMLGNWLVMCGDEGARKRSEGLSPVVIK